MEGLKKYSTHKERRERGKHNHGPPFPFPHTLIYSCTRTRKMLRENRGQLQLKKVITFVFAKGYFRCHLHHTPAEIKSFQAKTTPCLFDQPPPFDALFFHFANGWRPFNMKTRGRTAISLAISMNTDVSGSLGWRVVRVEVGT